jgi:dipeptidyl aminopeptidase/acylaminoacyl peptidase
MNNLSKVLLTFLVLFVVAIVGMGWFFSNIILFPQNTQMQEDIDLMPERWGMTYEEVTAQLPTPIDFSVQSVDDVTIKGWLYDYPDTARCAVIYSHGWGSSRAGMLKFADLFWDCGCDLVFYDHRMHNESGGIVATAGIKEKEDLLSVTNWLQANYGYSDQQIAWFGESWGGATVLQAGATEKDVAFIVADSPFQDWDSAIFERGRRQYGDWLMNITPVIMGLVDWRAEVDHNEASPRNAAKSIKEPVFLIHSRTDEATASYQSENIAKNLSPETSEFHHTDWGSTHVQDIITRPEEYRRLLYNFIQDKVGTFGTCPE